MLQNINFSAREDNSKLLLMLIMTSHFADVLRRIFERRLKESAPYPTSDGFL